MKKILLFFLLSVITFSIQAQSWGFCVDESTFPNMSVVASGDQTNTTGPFEVDVATQNPDGSYDDSATDGTNDISITMTAVANGSGTDPNGTGCTAPANNYVIGTSVGPDGTGTQNPGSGLSSAGQNAGDFASETDDDCLCAGGYVIVQIDFINGFTSDASVFDIDWTSLNGDSEGYEWGFGYVSGTDAGGNPFGVTFTESDILNYCTSDWTAGTTMSQFLGVNGMPGVFTGDDLNTTFATQNDTDDDGNPGNDYTGGQNVCDGFNDNEFGEDTPNMGASGPSSDSDAQSEAGANVGLGAMDQVTSITLVYGLSNANGTDCTEDGVVGDTGVNTTPSANWGAFCVGQSNAVPCGVCTAGGGLFITELSYDPSGTQGTDGSCEYIEIYNGYSTAIMTDGTTMVTLSGGTSVTLPAGITIMPGEYIILTGGNFSANCTWANPPPAGTQIIDAGVAGDLSNGGESVTVTLSCGGNTEFTQTVAFSDGTTPNAGGGGDAVYYPFGAATTSGMPSPGSGDCAGCGVPGPAMCTLPVELAFFTGKVEDNGILLQWRTLSELDNDYFQVERSLDGKNFEAIASIQGAGTSVESKDYMYLDSNAKSGYNYYRLKQLDFDGSYEYSDVVLVNTNMDDLGTKVYPVPITTSLVIETAREINAVEVMDITGRIVLISQFDATVRTELNISELVAGTYFVSLKGEQGIETIRVIKN